jgi:lipopolysaccharide transport system ATP-binding protein
MAISRAAIYRYSPNAVSRPEPGFLLDDVSTNFSSGSTAPFLRATSVGKRYPLFRSPGHRLARALLGNFARKPDEYTALEDINFEIQPGDALAVIGRNGAGKSTLLQILSGVLEPDTGTVETPARVAALLELGSGFNPEFTGRENVFINAAILGIERRHAQERLEEIIAFADIGAYIDQPVKTYSSGMFLRLAFSVAINVEPDLLLVDEALTVGDVFFQQKCYARLAEMRARGMSVLLVTHSMADAAEFCNLGLVLSQGRVAFAGGGKEAVEYYFHHERETPTGRRTVQIGPQATSQVVVDPGERKRLMRIETTDLAALKQFGQSDVRAIRMLITDEHDEARRVFVQGDWMRVYVDYQTEEELSLPISGLEILNARGALVHGRNSLQFDGTPAHVPSNTVLRCVQEVKLDIEVGQYTLDVGIAELPLHVFARRHLLVPTEIAPQIRLLCHVSGASTITVVHRREGHPCLFSHYGLANLQSHQRHVMMPDEPAAAD